MQEAPSKPEANLNLPETHRHPVDVKARAPCPSSRSSGSKQAAEEALHIRGQLGATPGEIIIDAKGAASLPGVYAAGNATTVPFKQIIIAAGDGAKAALAAFAHLIRTPVAA
jgi:hypothetical protein